MKIVNEYIFNCYQVKYAYLFERIISIKDFILLSVLTLWIENLTC